MLHSNTEEGIRTDIRAIHGPAYYAEVKKNDNGFSARATRFFGRHWKKIALGFAGGFAVAGAPLLAVTAFGTPAATLAAVETFAMLVSTFTMLTGMATMTAVCLFDGDVVRKANKNIEADINNGTLLAPYRESLMAAKKLEAEKLAAIMDKMTEKGRLSADFAATAAHAPAQETVPPAQAPTPVENTPKR